jgi:DNA mismatch endonuclease, patch repair protein
MPTGIYDRTKSNWKPWNTGLKGYTNSGSFKKGNINRKGFHHTNEVKILLSQKSQGRTPWNKDKPMQYKSEESRQKVLKNLKPGARKGKKGFKMSKESSIKKSLALSGKPRKSKGIHRINKGTFKKGEKPKPYLCRFCNITHDNWSKCPISSKIQAEKQSKIRTGKPNLAVKESRLYQIFPAKDSSIEVLCQTQLNQKGIFYLKHVGLIGQPDMMILNSGYENTCIFTDGCATHPCSIHTGRINKAFNDEKKKAYDAMVTQSLIEMGYNVVRIWEHDIKKPDFDILNYIKRDE